MKERIITANMIIEFKKFLYTDEKSENTIEKYMRDVNAFFIYVAQRALTKTIVMEYKTLLPETHAITSANSMLAAVNTFLRFLGWNDYCVKQFKVQRQAYCSEEKELTKKEYVRLLNAAKSNGNERLNLIIQTICGTGIRVSELKYITIEALKKGEAIVCCKGKTRTIFIVKELRRLLLQYSRKMNIESGSIFVTRNGKPISRCNIWRDMKALCEEARVNPNKVFPHNLRHLFARTFYGIEKDIAKLADVLGHSSINTTRIYIMTTGAEHRKKLENMHLIM